MRLLYRRAEVLSSRERTETTRDTWNKRFTTRGLRDPNKEGFHSPTERGCQDRSGFGPRLTGSTPVYESVLGQWYRSPRVMSVAGRDNSDHMGVSVPYPGRDRLWVPCSPLRLEGVLLTSTIMVFSHSTCNPPVFVYRWWEPLLSFINVMSLRNFDLRSILTKVLNIPCLVSCPREDRVLRASFPSKRYGRGSGFRWRGPE